MADFSHTLTRRPALVTFAGIMLILLGGLQITWAIVEFANAAWLRSTIYGTFNGYLWLWGILDGIIGLASLYAGFDVFAGGRFGQVYGVVVASIRDRKSVV